MRDLKERIIQVNSLAAELATYYKAHTIHENQIFTQLASALMGRNLALMYLLDSPSFAFGEREINKLIELIEPTDAKEGARLRAMIPHIIHILPGGRERLKSDYVKELTTDINTMVHLGRSLLKSRQLKSEGMSDAKIQEILDADEPQNIF